jgi:hypothetical protein
MVPTFAFLGYSMTYSSSLALAEGQSVVKTRHQSGCCRKQLILFIIFVVKKRQWHGEAVIQR